MISSIVKNTNLFDRTIADSDLDTRIVLDEKSGNNCINFYNKNIFSVSINEENKIGIGTKNPDQSSIVDISSVDSGVLIPRMTEFQRNSILKPATGLLIYNNDSNQFNYFDGEKWVPISQNEGNITGEGEKNRITRWGKDNTIKDSLNELFDSGRIKFNSEIESPIQLKNLETAPTSNLEEGQLSFIDNDLYFFDDNRRKWLSIGRDNYFWSKNSYSTSQFLSFGLSNYSNIGPRINYDGTITNIEIKITSGDMNKKFDLLVNSETKAVFSLNGVNQYKNNLIDIDFNENDLVSIFCSSEGDPVLDPIFSIGTRWRK